MGLPKLNLPYIAPKYKVLAAAGAVMLVGIFYYDHAFTPLVKEKQKLVESMELLDGTLQTICTVDYPGSRIGTALLQRIRVGIETRNRRLHHDESVLIGRKEVSKILELITTLANEAGITVNAIEPQAFEQRQLYTAMPLHLEFTARYAQLQQFLRVIADLPVIPERMRVSVRQRPLVDVSLQLAIFLR